MPRCQHRQVAHSGGVGEGIRKETVTLTVVQRRFQNLMFVQHSNLLSPNKSHSSHKFRQQCLEKDIYVPEKYS
jgi:hypothetical protein